MNNAWKYGLQADKTIYFVENEPDKKTYYDKNRLLSCKECPFFRIDDIQFQQFHAYIPIFICKKNQYFVITLAYYAVKR